MARLKLIHMIFMIMLTLEACSQESFSGITVLTGAEQSERYIPMLENRTVALVANHSSLIGGTHLADTLLSLGINVVKVFSPEHGFRGQADAGEQVADDRDPKTGLALASLYGNNKKPSAESLEGIDIVMFDIQDVGVRFYTYISTLSYVMEAAAEQGIPFIVLDRPNPNGFYIDGPVMQDCCKSFVGLHPVPVVYGMTIGEYALMVNGEGWLRDGINCDLTVIPLKNYQRDALYPLPVRPSPNLPDWQSVYLYPSLCLFEGTVVSIGRGTDFPFTVYGHPDIKTGSFVFTPAPGPGAANPKLNGIACYGQNLVEYANNYLQFHEHFNLEWLINAYREIGMGEEFFSPYFEKLAGTERLREQIMSGLSQEEIKAGWQAELQSFKIIRKKYLLYTDIP